MTTQDLPGSADTNLVRYPYRRGARVFGADGAAVGTLEQIVVDRDSGVLRGLIVRSLSGEREFELPEDRVSRNEGDTVHLSVRGDELETHPELARPYDPRDYQPVEPIDAPERAEASRIALETGQPVVATVGDNAAEVVAPEASAPVTDGQAVAETQSATLAEPQLTAPSTDQKVEGGAPDVTAGGSGLGDAQEDATSTTDAPPQTPSATESTTGELVGGKPSTGGMGAASVAPVQSYPQDASATQVDTPSDPERASDPGMIGAFREAGDRPAFSNPGEPLPDLTAVSTADATLQNEQRGPLASPAPPPLETVPEPRVAPTTFPLPPSQPAGPSLPSWATPRVLLMGGSIGAGMLAGIMLRRQQQRPGVRARRAAATARHRLTDTVAQAGESTAQAARGAARGARRTAKRGRWFRRGLMLGGALGVLFAPQPGERLRARLRENANRRWSREG